MEVPVASSVPLSPVLIAATVATAMLLGAMLWSSRAEPHRRARLVATGAAVLLLAAIWFTPLEVIAQHYLLSAHLVQITVLMGAVPPLILLGLPGSAPRRPRPVWLRRFLAVFVHPLFAIIAVNGAFFGWHLTAPYSAAMQDSILYELQQVSLLVASLLFWWPIVSPLGQSRPMSPLTTMGYIVLATIPQTFGGLAVALAHHLLYPLYGVAPRITTIDPLTDQQIAGACIALLSKVALFTAFTVLLLRLLGSSDAESDDGGGGGGGSSRRDQPRPAPSGTPKWLDDLQRGRTVPEPAAPGPLRVPAGAGSRRA